MPNLKKVNVQFIPENAEGPETGHLYPMLRDLVEKHHQELRDARIALAWRFGWKEDADGNVTMGMARKASDVERELHPYDFVILLNHEVCTGGDFPEERLRALLDHELCHCRTAMDELGNPQRDERGRVVYRIAEHDLEEFVEVVERHGAWSHEIQRIAAAATGGSSEADAQLSLTMPEV